MVKVTNVSREEQAKNPFHRPGFLVRVEGADVPQEMASYESKDEWALDPAGYVIIKVFYDRGLIGARHFTNDHAPTVDVLGKDAEAIVQTFVRKGLVSTLQHAAYLGHELHKAEIALALRLNFVQDSELDFSRKTSKNESDNLPE